MFAAVPFGLVPDDRKQSCVGPSQCVGALQCILLTPSSSSTPISPMAMTTMTMMTSVTMITMMYDLPKRQVTGATHISACKGQTLAPGMALAPRLPPGVRVPRSALHPTHPPHDVVSIVARTKLLKLQPPALPADGPGS